MGWQESPLDWVRVVLFFEDGEGRGGLHEH